MADAFERIAAAIQSVEDLPPNYGVVLLTWDQTTHEINSNSNLPPEYVAALLKSWLKRLPEPTEDFQDFDKTH